MDTQELQAQLYEALSESARLKAENIRLKKLLGLSLEESSSPLKITFAEPPVPYSSSIATVNNNSSPTAKVALFRSLFRGREDVYPVRWERKDGKSGYSPACALEWKRPLCGKPAVKCAGCKNRKLLPITDEVIHGHLTGKHIIGVYPLLSDETCWFLAADFDKKTWQEDASAFLNTCHHLGISAALERSRSGTGGHVWIFFEDPVPASLARKLGCSILTRTLGEGHQLGLDSYDRFFPNQDTLPKGGFGNLIALPLQWVPREKGNSVFLNSEGFPYSDQWQFLSTLKKFSIEELEARVREASRTDQIIDIRISLADETAEEDPWTLPPSQKRKEVPIPGPFPPKVRLVQGNLIYIEKKGFPPALINRLIRLAAFQKAKAKYVLGLTATPIRKDGHHPIVLMQCGPIRFKENPKKVTIAQPFEHYVNIDFVISQSGIFST